MAVNAEVLMKPTPTDLVRVLVVDDDELFRESLQQNLIDTGFDSWAFGDGPSVLAFLEDGNRADLILLDWRMPGMTGIEVLRKLRNSGHEVPVIFLTALSDQMYEEAALIGGAVDFVEKSRSYTILKRRIELIMDGPKAQLAEVVVAQDNEATFVIGDLTLHPEIGRADWGTNRINLTLTEFRIVHLLARQSGRDVRYREIYDLVRGEGFIAGMGEQGYRANVRAFIKRIRQKFREADNGFDRIENYPGFGYRWRVDP
ncbi:MAG: response regulator [Alphaproteobacteria bacterium]|nr:response regulator [Alphaproteobacteria bacterium]